MHTLKIGSMLRHDTYRIEKVLGQGGFGITYLATDISLDRKVAIKEFFPKDYCDREGTTSHVTLGTQNTSEFVNRLKAKFIKEAKNIAKLDNPGIIKIHAAFEENNTAYYVMDFIEGESLSAMVKRDGPLPAQTALRYITEVGEALEYVHKHRINHLDVKPANIMVRRSDNKPVLIDFGLSKQYDSDGNQTSTTPTGISHGYAPMEQYNDGGVKEFSPQTDLYSLAATLYYILTGIVPPQATRLVDDELTFPSTIPTRLVPPIAKAMSTGRRNRQETIRKFLEDINGDSETEIRPRTVSSPKPQLAPAPEPVEFVSDDSYYESDESEDKAYKNKYIIGGIVAIIVAAAVMAIVPRSCTGGGVKTDNEADSLKTEEIVVVKTVSDMDYNSSLGACSYTGEVDDSGSKPHGEGRAEWKSGIGKYYDGQWVHGEMDGECIYMNRDGYKFEGKFKNGHYYEGKLISPDKSYYVGSFDKNGNKWTGTEYDAKGNKTDTWKNGQ